MENLIEKIKVMDPLAAGSSFGENLVAKLNHDCLAKIVQYVSVLERLRLEKVSQEWKEIISALSWHDIKKLDFNDLMITLDKREEILKKIMKRCCRFLTSLKITDNQYPWMCNVLTNNSRNIVHFSIDMNINRGYKILNEDLIQIITSMPKLKYLKISVNLEDGCSSNLCNEILEKLPENMEEIHWTVPSDKVNAFNTIAPELNKFHRLHCLTLQKLCLTDVTIESIYQNANTLVKLDLSQCKFAPEILSLSYLRNLEQLILWSVTNFNLEEFIFIAQYCSNLKHFEFSNRDDNGSEVIVPFYFFSQLTYLKLEHIKFHKIGVPNANIDDDDFDENENGIAKNWLNLKYLNISGSCYFSLFNIPEITELKNLEFLDLNGITVDSESFVCIASNCLELKALIMRFANWLIEDIPETDLEKLTNLKKLEILDLSCCGNLTGNLLTKIVNNCQNLMDLKLTACHNVTEDSLIEVGKLRGLKKLSIDNIENVPNAIFDNLHNLEFLSCMECPSVTDEGIKKVIDNCQNLSTLNVFNTGVTVETLHHASKRKFVFKPLIIATSLCIRYKYPENFFPSSNLKIVSKLFKNFPLHSDSNVKVRSYW